MLHLSKIVRCIWAGGTLLGLMSFAWAQEVPQEMPREQPTRVRLAPPATRAVTEEVLEPDALQAASEEEQAAIALALRGDGARAAGGNIIRPGMPITVAVYVQGRAEISTEAQRINESGRIALPLIQNVTVANQSLEGIEAQLTELYNDYFREPHVIVEFVGNTNDPYQSPWGFVTMIGRVGQEGPVAIPPTRNMTLSGAIKFAGGTAPSANTTSIVVYRPDIENDRVRRINVNLSNVGRRGNHEDDILLKAGDVVFIPERIF